MTLTLAKFEAVGLPNKRYRAKSSAKLHSASALNSCMSYNVTTILKWKILKQTRSKP